MEERSKKWVLLWSRAVVHFSVCFAIGALAAVASLAATGTPSIDSIRASFLPSSNAQRVAPPPPPLPDLGLLLIVTVTRPDDDDGVSQEASLARLGHTLRLVEPPLLWIVVGAKNKTATARAVQVLRGTGVMFRHLTYAAENVTDTGDVADHQRNVALSHMERHRLAGVVHFASASGVYGLGFFQELRQTRGFAAWPIATVSSADQRVTVQGPTCNSSQITGWYSKDSSTNAAHIAPVAAVDTSASLISKRSEINISGLGFRSSVLWDSERFIHSINSSTGATQDFIQFVRQMAIDDGDKLKVIPSDCSESKIMLWHLDMPRYAPKIEEQETQQEQSLMEGEEDDYNYMT